ncbi:hypothetical protein [Spirillospora sp. NPDC029432]|uniref:hypothetical protein n=1 Tax=Spirillospora sp. NPDC029432 TaxID=3154599 RepID=UPI003456B8FE
MVRLRTRRRPESGLAYRLFLRLDVEKYSRLDTRQQVEAQEDLRRLVDESARLTGLMTDDWYRQGAGDGELVAFPADIDILRTVGTFTHRLQSGLQRLNLNRNPDLRLRVAFHHGTMAPGPLGPAGDGPIVVSRLLDADPLRAYLTEHPDLALALAVSESLYNDVIRTGLCELAPERFIPLEVEVKQVVYRGYIYDGNGSPA